MIVSAVRTAVGRAKRGTLVNVRPDEMAAVVIREVLNRAAPVRAEDIEDVIMGCSFPEAEQGMNVARIALLRAGLPCTVPGQTVNRFCSSGLQTIALAAEKIMAGLGTCIIAGGTESMSMVPMVGNKFSPNPWLVENYPEVYLSMGQTAENVACKYGISREEQDAFGYRSHVRAIAAQDAGKFRNEIVPLQIKQAAENGDESTSRTVIFDADEGPRRGTSLEAMAKLRPAFSPTGTVTAGNSSQMSDGAAAVILAPVELAEKLGLIGVGSRIGEGIPGRQIGAASWHGAEFISNGPAAWITSPMREKP